MQADVEVLFPDGEKVSLRAQKADQALLVDHHGVVVAELPKHGCSFAPGGGGGAPMGAGLGVGLLFFVSRARRRRRGW